LSKVFLKIGEKHRKGEINVCGAEVFTSEEKIEV